MYTREGGGSVRSRAEGGAYLCVCASEGKNQDMNVQHRSVYMAVALSWSIWAVCRLESKARGCISTRRRRFVAYAAFGCCRRRPPTAAVSVSVSVSLPYPENGMYRPILAQGLMANPDTRSQDVTSQSITSSSSTTAAHAPGRSLQRFSGRAVVCGSISIPGGRGARRPWSARVVSIRERAPQSIDPID